MTLAAVLTVFISLALFGGALYVRQAASQAEIVWQQQTNLTVWMKSNATSSELGNIKGELKSSPYVSQPCKYLNKQQNYDEALKIEPADIMAQLTPQDMTTSYICVPKIPANVTILQSAFVSQPGVYAVTAPYQQVKNQENVINIVQIVVLVLALALLASAAVLIWNTIRLAIFARRRELSVMKLVGATNWFIRVPYIVEGFMQGLIGSLVASGVVLCGQLIPLSAEFQLSLRDVLGTDIVVMIVGVLIGSLGAGVAIRRFLDV
jgi:cell division transport system permease protein